MFRLSNGALPVKQNTHILFHFNTHASFHLPKCWRRTTAWEQAEACEKKGEQQKRNVLWFFFVVVRHGNYVHEFVAWNGGKNSTELISAAKAKEFHSHNGPQLEALQELNFSYFRRRIFPRITKTGASARSTASDWWQNLRRRRLVFRLTWDENHSEYLFLAATFLGPCRRP